MTALVSNYDDVKENEYAVLINGLNVATVFKLESASRSYWHIELTEAGIREESQPSTNSINLGGWGSWDKNRKSIVYSKFEKLLLS